MLANKKALLAAAITLGCTAAWADINVGVTLSATGPAASLGIPEKNTIALLPQTIGGQKINYILLDDASDTTQTVTNTRKLITERNVDVIIGSSTTPTSLAMIDVVAEAQTPMISLGASAAIVEPQDAKKRWVFKTPQNDIMMALAIAEHMAANGVKTVGFIGFSDAYGEGWYRETVKALDLKKIKLVANERFSRTDTAVTGQVLKLMAPSPTPSWWRARARRPRCRKRRSRSAATPASTTRRTAWPTTTSCAWAARTWKARCCRPARCWWPISCRPPTRCASRRWPTSAPTRAPRQGQRVHLRRPRLGRRPVLKAAIPVALKGGQPGTPQFRNALRDALEGVKEVPGAHGIFNMSLPRSPGPGPACARDGEDRKRHAGSTRKSSNLPALRSRRGDHGVAAPVFQPMAPIARRGRHGFSNRTDAGAGRRRQRRHLCADGPGPGAGVLGHAGDLHSAGRIRRLRRAGHGRAAGRPAPPLLWMLLGLAALVLLVEGVRQTRGARWTGAARLFWAALMPALAVLVLLVLKPQAMLLQRAGRAAAGDADGAAAVPAGLSPAGRRHGADPADRVRWRCTWRWWGWACTSSGPRVRAPMRSPTRAGTCWA
jgi:branched-chain amino acid transport system substrate-binding protein